MKAIVAMARNRVIGKDGRIPWHLPEDLRWFKKRTMGGVVAMGRKTFESLGKPLPGRRNVVISRNHSFPGVETFASVGEFLATDFRPEEVWIIGGGEIYAQLLPHCTDLYLSLVEAEPEGDAFFPPFEENFRLSEIVERQPGFEIHHYCRA
jgi:dihydrofolate reductase